MLIRLFAWSVLLLISFSRISSAQEFVLSEELGREWTNEVVSFPLDSSLVDPDQYVLKNSNGKSIPHQLIANNEGQQRILFQVNLPPYVTQKYFFAPNGKADHLASDLVIEDSADYLRISNGKTGVSLRKKPADGKGPIAGIKLNSGTWVGDSRLLSNAKITDWQVEIVANGSVMIEAICTITFDEQGVWRLRFKIYAKEPVVLVDEQYKADKKPIFQLILDKNYAADYLFYRYGKRMSDGRVGKNATWKIATGKVFEMEPWLSWWIAQRRGSTFSLYDKKGSDLLTVAARNAGDWVDPEVAPEKRANAIVNVVRDARGLHADFPISKGSRSWMLGAFDRDTSLEVLNDSATAFDSPLPYQYLIKYGHFPLDKIKDYVLTWPSKTRHPQMLVTDEDVARFRARNLDIAAYQKKADYFVKHPQTLTPFSMDDAIPAFLATNDDRLGNRIAEMGSSLLEQWVDSMFQQKGLPFGAAPHMRARLAAGVGFVDLLFDSKHISAEIRSRLQAKAAFLSYTLSRPEYWSTKRGFSANPNMTTSVYGYRTALASFISDHPMAESWAGEGLSELKNQLNTWSDSGGGWLEAPHYAAVSYDQILGGLVMASNAGFNDWLYNEKKIKLVARWFAKIDTPPDSRIGGFRHHPAIGNTYLNEPSGDYGLLAYLFRDYDPDFSAEMQWQFKQNNMYGAAGIGGFFPAFAGYRKILTDPSLVARAPNYESELFPQTGVVLRDFFPSDRETYLHMILGRNHEHYDHDSGSILLYGKGRILADEFGYYGAAPEEDHSMVELIGMGKLVSESKRWLAHKNWIEPEVMEAQKFVKGPRFDYISGRKGPWVRQIAMVKGATLQEPTFFVIHDKVDRFYSATWRLWLTAKEVQIGPNSAVAVGKEDVDMDIFFLSPDTVQLRKEVKTRKSGSGLYPNWKWKGMTTIQTGLIASMEMNSQLRVVLFPRYKTQKPAKFIPIAQGKGVKVVHDFGTDYVFFNDDMFDYKEDELTFKGRVGMIQLREDVILGLGESGSISAQGKILQKN